MKFIKITGVLSLHACLAAMLIFQSGCRTMEYSEELDSACVVMTDSKIEPDYLEVYEEKNVVIGDNFVPATPVSCTRICDSRPIENRRFKPTRPACDFSNDGLLTSVNDIEPVKSVSSFATKPVTSQETYNVKSGDSLWVIAKRYKISMGELASANGLNRDSILKVGQKLIVPAGKNSGEIAPAVDGSMYTIAKGDTLSEIAIRFKVSVDAIKKANNLQSNVIIAGKKIIIPGVSSQMIATAVPSATSRPTPLSASKEGTYRVQTGDSLSVIANRFGVTVADLMTWNNMTDARKLRAGQSLIVNNQTTHTASSSQTSSNDDSHISMPDFDTRSSGNTGTDTLSEEESMPFDLFEDEDLFDTSNEIPVLTNQE